jgi:hypothetical protein
MSLHPLSLAELGNCQLPEGTCVEGARALLKQAEAAGESEVRIRVLDSDGCVELKRVAVSDLRSALESSSAG